ncbi:MAG: hypothetical protein Q7J44_18365 [Pseudotabrizicola sp.]|uniref:hypothetical protein n=1 Tax=Pseudotabrizicola sp. TaxID=2939647 RepID=UPI0027279367|nr:hypothetical protein [Pseudotabrizicola sp.]MDO9640503.1 hypothetical protein [Pseudotabrizicola sp.]
MIAGALIPFLSLITMLAVLVFAMISKARVEERRHDPNAPKSTLAKDGKYGGVGFLVPLREQSRAMHAAQIDAQRGHSYKGRIVD